MGLRRRRRLALTSLLEVPSTAPPSFARARPLPAGQASLRRFGATRSVSFHPRGFSPPRWLAPCSASRACCIPLTTLGSTAFPGVASRPARGGLAVAPPPLASRVSTTFPDGAVLTLRRFPLASSRTASPRPLPSCRCDGLRRAPASELATHHPRPAPWRRGLPRAVAGAARGAGHARWQASVVPAESGARSEPPRWSRTLRPEGRCLTWRPRRRLSTIPGRPHGRRAISEETAPALAESRVPSCRHCTPPSPAAAWVDPAAEDATRAPPSASGSRSLDFKALLHCRVRSERWCLHLAPGRSFHGLGFPSRIPPATAPGHTARRTSRMRPGIPHPWCSIRPFPRTAPLGAAWALTGEPALPRWASRVERSFRRLATPACTLRAARSPSPGDRDRRATPDMPPRDELEAPGLPGCATTTSCWDFRASRAAFAVGRGRGSLQRETALDEQHPSESVRPSE
jgi:hypothetical protein